MKKIIMKILFTIALIMGTHLCIIAQPADGDPGDDPDRVPLDPGTWVLVAAGAGYGIKKWRDAKKVNKRTGQDVADYLPKNNVNEVAE